MSTVRFISDLHLGHRRILEFSGRYRGGGTVDEHDAWIVKQWNSVVSKRDTVWVLGDVAFSEDALGNLALMNGRKNLIFGNHDRFPLSVYLNYFERVHGFCKANGFWLSHSPIHPSELRGRINVHGHVHHNDEALRGDDRYLPVCVEQTAGCPVSVDDLRSGTYWGRLERFRSLL